MMKLIERKVLGHIPFEAEVVRELQSVGFHVGSPAYHDHMPAEVQDRLMSLETPTTAYARGGPDLFAIHGTLPIAFFCEIKTHLSKTHFDFTSEARQWVQRVEEAAKGCLCLYCFRAPWGVDVGWWMHRPPMIRNVAIPKRWSDEQAAEWQRAWETVLPDVPYYRTKQSPLGTNAPYVVIARDQMVDLPNWSELVDDFLFRGTVE